MTDDRHWSERVLRGDRRVERRWLERVQRRVEVEAELPEPKPFDWRAHRIAQRAAENRARRHWRDTHKDVDK